MIPPRRRSDPTMDLTIEAQQHRWDQTRRTVEEFNQELRDEIEILTKRIAKLETTVGELGRAAARELRAEGLDGYRPYQGDRPGTSKP